MTVSFKGVGEQVLTFASNSTTPAAAGKPVKMSGNGEVTVCAAGDRLCGVALTVSDGLAAVQTGGVITIGYTGTAPSVGYAQLAADGSSGVKTVASGGAVYLVLAVNSTAATVTFIL